MIIQRYIFTEILKAFALTLFIITMALFLGTSFQIVRRYSQIISLLDIIEVSPYLIMSSLAVTLPLALLAATSLSYGRMAQDQEILIMRISGIHLHVAILPVILIGAMVSLLSFYLHSTLVPLAFQKKREITNKAIKILLKATLPENEATISFIPDVKIYYKRREGAHFTQILIQHLNKLDITEEIIAATGDLIIDDKFNQILFHLKDGSITHMMFEKNARVRQDKVSFREVTIPIHIPETESDPFKALKYKTTSELSMLEIKVRAEIRIRERLLHKLEANTSLGEWGKREANSIKKRLVEKNDDLNEILTEYHKRLATALGPLLVVLIGAPLGILIRHGNKLVAFGISAVPMILLYYPLMVFGEILGQDGKVPPILAMWTSVVITLCLGVILLIYVYRS